MPVAMSPLAEVVGYNCKRLRGLIGITQDELARYGRNAGLRWRASSVGDFEAGRSAPSFATVIAVAAALQLAAEDLVTRLGDRPLWAGAPTNGVQLADLVDFGGIVAVNDALLVPGSALSQWLGDSAASLSKLDSYASKEATAAEASLAGADEVLARSGLAEQRMAKGLNISPEVLALASFELWGSTFGEERDRRAGVGANKQKRGQVTRVMRAELASAIAKGLK